MSEFRFGGTTREIPSGRVDFAATGRLHGYGLRPPVREPRRGKPQLNALIIGPALKGVAEALRLAGIACEIREDHDEAMRVITSAGSGSYDAAVLSLADEGTWSLLDEICAKNSGIPTILVADVHDRSECLRALRAGADVYVARPLDEEDLVERMRAVVRRNHSLPTLRFGELHLNLARRIIECRGHILFLSPKEFDLMHVLTEKRGTGVTRDTLLKRIWDLDYEPESPLLEVLVSRVRRKLRTLPDATIERVNRDSYRINIEAVA